MVSELIWTHSIDDVLAVHTAPGDSLQAAEMVHTNEQATKSDAVAGPCGPRIPWWQEKEAELLAKRPIDPNVVARDSSSTVHCTYTLGELIHIVPELVPRPLGLSVQLKSHSILRSSAEVHVSQRLSKVCHKSLGEQAKVSRVAQSVRSSRRMYGGFEGHLVSCSRCGKIVEEGGNHPFQRLRASIVVDHHGKILQPTCGRRDPVSELIFGHISQMLLRNIWIALVV
jgi:hypothetical protein